MPGHVVTFYSYKGGVGRSFALVNIAAVLAEWGYDVMCIDFDIEAPGLSHYFRPWISNESTPGLVDMIENHIRSQPVKWTDYSQKIDLPFENKRGSLALMAAGEQNDDFSRRVQRLNWDAMYEESDLGKFLEDLRADWKERFDYILIDGRTGITAFSGIFTAQLPDILVFLFTANHQSLNGCIDVVKRAADVRNNLPHGRGAFLTLPVPSRFEVTEEYERKEEWKKIFARELCSFTEAWAHKDIDLARLIDLSTIPYFSYWSFGEEIASLKEKAGPSGVRNTGLITYSIETLAAMLAHNLGRTDLLEESRDSYVHSAQRKAQRRGERFDVFLSYFHKDAELANWVTNRFENNGLKVWLDKPMTVGQNWLKEIEQAINRSDNIVVLVGREFGKTQEEEIRRFMKGSIMDDRRRRVIPVLIDEKAHDIITDSYLADYQHLEFYGKSKDKLLESLIRDLTKSESQTESTSQREG
ncbi:MAG: hypothetical protein NPIRA05_19150 [Nitrospirales bacterium]|nr:MAG: hypothetical protein NPIRA05_19150 [Nitrospirales bacterium]